MDIYDDSVPLNNWQVSKTSPIIEEYVVYHDLPGDDVTYDPTEDEYHNSRESAERRAAVLNSMGLRMIFDTPEEIAEKVIEAIALKRRAIH